MSAKGDVIHFENGDFSIDFDGEEIVVTMRVVNESSTTDYPIMIAMSISAGPTLIAQENIESLVSPGNTREYVVRAQHSLSDGDSYTVCADVKIDDDNIGGL